MIFFDGTCGLCHHAVRFALRHDPQGALFRFAPLQGSTFQEQIPAAVAAGLADSIVVEDIDGSLLQQSDAVLLLLAKIGGGWGSLGYVMGFIPRVLRNLVYQAVARIRHLVFRRPPDLCPVVPLSLRDRFLP